MNESRRLEEQVLKILNGEAWYGPSWREVLDGVGLPAALQRPVPNGHSIAEIVLHTITWQDVARRRLQGESPPQPTDEEDWPRVTFHSEEEWNAAKRTLFESGRALAEAIGKIPEERLDQQRPNNAGTWYTLMIGMVEHDVYHAGQVGLLRKATATVTA